METHVYSILFKLMNGRSWMQKETGFSSPEPKTHVAIVSDGCLWCDVRRPSCAINNCFKEDLHLKDTDL